MLLLLLGPALAVRADWGRINAAAIEPALR